MPTSRLRYTISLAASGIALGMGAARAEAPASADVETLLKAVSEQAERLNAQEKAIEDSRKALEDQQRNLLQERARFNQLKAQVSTFTGRPVADAKTQPAAKPPEAAAAATAVSDTAGGAVGKAQTGMPQEVGVDRKPDEDKPPEIAAVIEQGGVLLKQGRAVFTPSVEYTRSSATRVAIQGFSIIPALNIGLFEVTKTDRDTLTGSVGLRYGVTNRFEVETKVPYVYRSDSTRTRPVGTGSSTESLSNVDGNDIGDVEFGAHYQINNGQGGWPFLIGNMRLKTATGTNPYEVPINSAGVETELPTGSGFYALQPSITAIYPSDPVVFYGNTGYLHNFKRDFGGTVGEIEPGDSVNASFGMSLSLNDKASFSLGYSHNTVFEPKQNGVRPSTSTMLQVGTLDLGYSYNLTDRTNLNFAVSAGITEDAPDARLTLRVPLTYDLF